jgi:phage N-6-adenine-methyltransferase
MSKKKPVSKKSAKVRTKAKRKPVLKAAKVESAAPVFDNQPIPRDPVADEPVVKVVEVVEAGTPEAPKGPGGPRITKGKSDGDYATPDNFLQAVQKKFGPIVYDLAAEAKNATCERFFSIRDDAFKQDWAAISMKYSSKIARGGFLWLNPPFSFIAPWASRCLQESKVGAETLFLVPASVGAKWFRDFVFRQADVYYLYGRLTFRGQTTPYPKDCMLVHFNPGSFGIPYGEQIWDWRKELVPASVPAEDNKSAESSTGEKPASKLGAVKGKADASGSTGAAAG